MNNEINCPSVNIGDYCVQLLTTRFKLRCNRADNNIINGVENAVEVLQAIFTQLDANQEHLVILMLDQKLRIKGYKVVASGTMTSAPVDSRVIFQHAMALNAESIIMSHNHLADTVEPSLNDINITTKIFNAGVIMDIKLIDHIIINAVEHHSIKQSHSYVFNESFLLW